MAKTMNPDDVETFLRAHPDFLQDRPALLAALNLPHGGQGAVSLVERQVAVLRERSITSRQKLAELSDIGRENERLLKATRETILALLSAETKADVAAIWQEQVVNAFAAEFGSLVWFDPDEQDDPRQSVAQKLLAGRDTVSGRPAPRGDDCAVSVGDLRGIGCHVLYSSATRGRGRHRCWRDECPAVSGRRWNAVP
jgi:uncharacterized protein YigA (DUF484 family)